MVTRMPQNPDFTIGWPVVRWDTWAPALSQSLFLPFVPLLPVLKKHDISRTLAHQEVFSIHHLTCQPLKTFRSQQLVIRLSCFLKFRICPSIEDDELWGDIKAYSHERLVRSPLAGIWFPCHSRDDSENLLFWFHVSRDRPFERTFQDEMWDLNWVLMSGLVSSPVSLRNSWREWQLRVHVAELNWNDGDLDPNSHSPLSSARGTLLTDFWPDGNTGFPKQSPAL